MMNLNHRKEEKKLQKINQLKHEGHKRENKDIVAAFARQMKQKTGDSAYIDHVNTKENQMQHEFYTPYLWDNWLVDIGTGKDLNEYVINGKQIPYHLIDILDAGADYNLHLFQISPATCSKMELSPLLLQSTFVFYF